MPFAAGLDVTASMGICDIATAGDGDALLRRADEALYWAKAFGRDAALVWSARTASRIAAARKGTVPDCAHGSRVAALAVALAEARGWEADACARLHHRAARLHDLGKAALPDSLLERPGALSAPVRQHATIGAAMAELDDEPSDWIVATTSAGTARATRAPSPPTPSPRAPSCSRSPTPGTRWSPAVRTARR